MKNTNKFLVLMSLCLALGACGGEKKQKVPDDIYDRERYVDLGLSVMWADRNVGAFNPTDYGNYYRWGDIMERDKYTGYTCAEYNNVIAGHFLYDVVRAEWGKSWRLPLYTEFEELINKCTWSATIRNDVYGALVTGPNGNSIFLPFGGYKDGSENPYFLIEEAQKGEKTARELLVEEDKLYSKERGETGNYLTASPFDKAYFLKQNPYYKETNAGRREFEKFEKIAYLFFMMGKATSVGGEIVPEMKGFGYNARGVLEKN